MKKFLLVVISVIMALCMVACGNDQESMESGEAKKLPKFDTSYDIEETVLVDENDVKITATGLTYTDYEVQVNVLLENNSDKNLSFYTGSYGEGTNAVNGYVLGGYMDEDVAAGSNINAIISYSIEDLQRHGMTEIADFLFAFTIEDEDGESFETSLTQVKTKAAEDYDYSVSTYAQAVKNGIVESIYDCEVNYVAEDVLYEQNGVRVVSQTLLTDTNGLQEVFLEVVNDSEETVWVALSNTAINGLLVDSRDKYGDIVYPGTRRVITIPVYLMINSEFSEYLGISEIGNMTVNLELSDADDEAIANPQEIEIVFAENVAMFEADGTEIFNREGIRVLSKGILKTEGDSSDYGSWVLLVENTRDEKVCFDAGYDIDYNSLSINGTMVESFFASMEVLPGKVAFVEIWFEEEALQEKGIASIESITEAGFLMEVRNDAYNLVAEATLEMSY